MKNTPRRALAVAAACLAAFFAPVLAFAQDKPDRPPWAQPKPKAKPPADASTVNAPPLPAASPEPPPPGGIVPTPETTLDRPDDAGSQNGQIKVKVDLVSILASVLDEHNRPAPDLPVEAFELYEEGVKQKIEVFESETQQPLDLALMVDASLSAHKEISFEQEAAAHFIRQVLRPGDRLSVFSFDENVTQLAAFSDNVATLQSAVRRIPPGSGTSIYDAVLLGARALERRGGERRRVIILVTDAGETTSRTDFDAARKEAVRSGALLYTVVIRPVKNESGRNTAGEHALETITDTTGGAMFYPDSGQDLPIIFDTIDRELRTQYRLGYYPTPRGPANTYRNVEVKVLNGEYHVRHRRTYLTGPQ
ncbi:MAG TPA: VWA domain-containing protein [Candidatus Methylomirabilis sp.]|nr:VWA domain-containing protein [Candidatus Methylomirabilis sp.]